MLRAGAAEPPADGVSSSGGSSVSASSALESATVLVQGMGGSGKTVVAVGIARDPEVGAWFQTIAFAGVGQDGDLKELQRSLFFQITGQQLDASLREDSAIFTALQAAAEERTLLLIVDQHRFQADLRGR